MATRPAKLSEILCASSAELDPVSRKRPFLLRFASIAPRNSLNSWGDDCFVIPEYSFAMELKDKNISISSEHQSFRWVQYDEAMELLKWDSNKTALWELNQRIMSNKLESNQKG